MARHAFFSPRIIRAFRLPALLAVMALPVEATEAPDQVEQLLSKVSSALSESNYRGLFTYEHGGTLQTFRVTHRVVDGVEEESLENLSGPPRRVTRVGTELGCLSPSERVLRGMFPTLDGSFSGLAQHYHFYVRNEERIAGREALLLQIVPRDEYRHGYTLAVDKESSVPLMAMTISTNRRVLERLQFASLDTEVDDSWLIEEQVVPSQQVFSTHCGDHVQGQTKWDVSWMPSGFIPTGNSTQDGIGDVLQFTDGLSSFSVFISPMDEQVSANGSVQRGATVAHMEQHVFNMQPYTVTVVGEIPIAAAQRVADSIRAIDAN